MSKFLMAAALAGAAVLGSVAPSSAAVKKPAPAPTPTATFMGTVAGPSDLTFFTFTTSAAGAGSYNVAASEADYPTLSFTSFDLYRRNGSLVKAGTITGPIGPFEFASLSANLTANTQYIIGVGTSGSGTFTGEVVGPGVTNGSTLTQVSGVPLPNSVALFGSAIAAVGVAGAVRRKTTAARAV